MKTNDTFNLARVGRLFAQNFINNYKLITFSLVGFAGGLTIILLFMQSVDEFKTLSLEAISVLFMILFFGLGTMYVGAAFPDFRRKEKTIGYLLQPASVLEKFFVEFVNRVVAFFVLLPILFLLVYNLEGLLLQLFYSKYEFVNYGIGEFLAWIDVPKEIDTLATYVLIASLLLMAFVIPFTGAAIFSKYPLVKTLFAVAILFFSYIGIIFLCFKVLNLEAYSVPDESKLLLIPTTPESVMRLVALASLLGNGLLLAAAYFKVKEKEV